MVSLEGPDKVRPYVAINSVVWQSGLAVAAHGWLWPGLERSIIAITSGIISPAVGDIGNC